MPDQKRKSNDVRQLRKRALSRWENEGGAVSPGAPTDVGASHGLPVAPPLTNAELSQLHIRVIALEGLVAALLAEASDRQLALVRGMTTYISPRPGFTDHPLTLRAANQMTDLVERALRFRDIAPS